MYYSAYVDMSGGSSDDACLAIAHRDEPSGRAVLDLVMNQGPAPPFDPRAAVKKFAAVLHEYGVYSVTGDAYAGETFRRDFESENVTYHVSDQSTGSLYEALEPKLNAGEVELLDVPVLAEQLMGLVMRGAKVTHVSGEHDDFATAAAGALVLAGDVRDCGVTL